MTQDLGQKEEVLSNKKVQKTIDNNSLTIAMTVLQTTQYSKPIESTVRELTCNGVDSITEKNNAVKILRGEARVEDYYIQQEGKEYEASKFNPDYYDLKWLSDKDEVALTYIENYTGEDKGFCDLLTIKDTGVGLGGERLKGYFNLNYSTKRCNTNTLGAFGLTY